MIYPEKYPENQKYDNSKEKEFYFRFLKELPSDWDVYYSFKFINPGLPVRELDYIIVCPIGVFVVELKNAKFRYEDNKWQIYDSREKDWKDHIKHFYSGPLEQVETGVKMLKDFFLINNHLHPPIDEQSIIGLLFMNKNETHHFPNFISSNVSIIFHKDLNQYSLFEILDIANRRMKSDTINLLEREKIKSIILMNGNYYPGFPGRRDIQNKVMIALNNQQLSIIEGIKKHPRMILSGVVGSGKTLMAFNALKIGIENNWKCLYLCSSENLRDYIRNSFEENNLLFAYSYYEFKFIEDNTDNYDFIVLDEAQNIISNDIIDTMESILKNGTTNGKWLVCLDKEQKNHDIETNFIDIISMIPHEKYSLNSNIRNPAEIFQIANLLGGKKLSYSRIPDALNVKFIGYKDENDASIKIFELIDYAIKYLKLTNEEIIILAPNSLDFSKELTTKNIYSHDNKKFYKITPFKNRTENSIGFSKIDEFQGLECPFVILIGIENLEDPYLRSQYYIALTRSTYSAGILYNEVLFDQLKELFDF
jgi:hypothetical protein